MDSQELVGRAWAARDHAHAPYSNFRVGAALLTGGGRIFSGCNVENVSFGLTMCAERVAIGAAVAAGERQFDRIAIVAESGVPVVPCGACRQVLAEFNPAILIVSANRSGAVEEFSLATLLPQSRQGILA